MSTLANGWHHMAAVGSGGSSTTFYIDGLSVGTVGYQTTANLKYLGNSGGYGQQFGTLDEMAVYTRALSALEVKARYLNGLPNHAPNQPTNSSPANGATGVSRTPALSSSAFSDPDVGNTHAASRWQIRKTTGAYGDADSYDNTSSVDRTSHTCSVTLAQDTVYFWRVQYQDNNGFWSQWSNETSFTTASVSQLPNVTAFTATSPSSSLDIPITSFTATDDVGVTGYQITTDSTPPAAGGGGWSGTAPATYTVGSHGTYTLYPWAKDEAGNVSAVFGSPRTVVTGAVSYWKFNEGSGTSAGDSVGANTGTISGATWTTGKSGNALSFNGSSNFVNTGSNASLQVQGHTFEAWIKLNADVPAGTSTILFSRASNITAAGYEWGIRGSSGNKLAFAYYDGAVRGWYLDSVNIPAGTGNWVHVAGVWNKTAGTVTFYINGVASTPVSTTTGTIAHAADDNSLIGCQPQNLYFNGIIDEVVIYNRALSGAEVAARYASY